MRVDVVKRKKKPSRQKQPVEQPQDMVIRGFKNEDEKLEIAEEGEEVVSVALTAAHLVNGERAQTHGPFDDNFNRAAAIFTAWTGISFTGINVNRVLQALKMAREWSNPLHDDNFVDQCGYIDLRYRQVQGVLNDSRKEK